MDTPRTRPGGPAWLGIGAQRSGTTWLTSLLLQHPRMGLATDSTDKELHAFDDALLRPWDGDRVAAYRDRFADVGGVRRGEFTPFYLRALWVPELARRACPDDVVLVVVLRDPIARFASAMRWYLGRQLGRLPKPGPLLRHWIRHKAPDAHWGGMYADHLAGWERTFDRERFAVLQYEAVRRDPSDAVHGLWARLGLEPQPLEDVASPSRTSTGDGWSWEAVPGLRESLVAAYEPGVQRLVEDWGIDRSLWPNFTR